MIIVDFDSENIGKMLARWNYIFSFLAWKKITERKKNQMEFGDIQTIITKAFEQTKSDQLVSLINWLDGEISRYRVSGLCKLI